MEFFETSGHNLLAAEAAAGVGHHVALSVVGTERLQQMGYFRAKLAQENLIKVSGIPYTIVRATQFFEFMGAIAQSATVGQTVHLPSAAFQPIAAEDVAAALTDVALGEPLNDTVEVAGPERTGLDEFIRRFLRGTKDPREVITDAKARYFGLEVNDQTLTPGLNPRIGPTFFEDWLSRSIPQNQASSAGSAPKTSRPSPRKSALGLLLFLCGIAFATPCVSAGSAHDTSNEKSKVTLVYEHVLPNVPGKSIKGVLVEYQPGGSSPAHTHPGSAFIYATVLQGAIRSQVNNGPVIVYRAGESFSEMPGDHHGVSANASETEPARLLAVFVVDTDEKNLTTNDTK
jgi:quercetin dioxygenase-like cupin family protein